MIAHDLTEASGAAAQRLGTRQLLVARTSFFVCSYIASALLARKLGSAAFGVYGVIASLILWVEMIANAGIPSATAKLIAEGRHQPSEIERASRALLLAMSLFLLTICWFAAPPIAELMGIPDGGYLLRLALLDLPLAGIYASYEGVLNGHRRFGAIAVLHASLGFAKLAGVLTLLALGFSVERVLVANLLTTAAVSAALLIRFPRRVLWPDVNVLVDMALIAGPMAVYLITGQVLLNLDLWSFKSLWAGEGDVVGQYVASANLARTLMLIPAVQAGVLFASVAWTARSDPTRAVSQIREATRFAIIVSVAASVILALNAGEVLSLLYSRQYAGGERFLWVQLAGFSLFSLVDAFANALQASGDRWRPSIALLPVVALVWLSCLFFIPRIGPLGAAISMVIGQGLSAVLTGLMVSRRIGSPVPLRTMMRVLVAVAAVALVNPLIDASGPWIAIKLAVLGGIYLAALYLQGEITAQDFTFVRSSG